MSSRTRFERTPGERLGEEIAELAASINASTCHLLDLIREFDDNEYRALQVWNERRSRQDDDFAKHVNAIVDSERPEGATK